MCHWEISVLTFCPFTMCRNSQTPLFVLWVFFFFFLKKFFLIIFFILIFYWDHIGLWHYINFTCTTLCFLNMTVHYSVCMLSCVQLFAAPWTLACQTPLSLGFPKAIILGWVSISFSRGSSWPRDWPRFLISPALAGEFFTNSPTWEAIYDSVVTTKNLFSICKHTVDPFTHFTHSPSPPVTTTATVFFVSTCLFLFGLFIYFFVYSFFMSCYK